MARLKEDPEKYCAYCEKRLHRKRINGRMEDMAIFEKRKYCNRLCMANGQIKEQATRSAFQKRVGKLREAACAMCGTSENLAIHHKDENWMNNDPSNLMTLCGSCHTKWHWQNGKKSLKRQSVCKICGQLARKLDMCQKHYQRYRKYGDPCLTKKRIGPHYELVREAPGVGSGLEYPESQEDVSIAWTDLKPLAMGKFRLWQRQHGVC